MSKSQRQVKARVIKPLASDTTDTDPINITRKLAKGTNKDQGEATGQKDQAAEQQTLWNVGKISAIINTPEGDTTEIDTEVIVSSDDDVARMDNLQVQAPLENRETENEFQADELRTTYRGTIVRTQKWIKNRTTKQYMRWALKNTVESEDNKGVGELKNRSNLNIKLDNKPLYE